MARSKNAPSKARGQETKYRAVELRKAGATYQQIGDQLGITKQSAHEAVTAAMRETAQATAETAADVIQLELARLDQMLTGLWGQARQGVPVAVDRVLRIMERRARLLGLDAEGPATSFTNVTVEVAWPRPDPLDQPEPLIIEGDTL